MASAEQEIEEALHGLRCCDEVMRAVREGVLGAQRATTLAHLIASDVRAAAGKAAGAGAAQQAAKVQPALEEFPPADAIYLMRAQSGIQPRSRLSVAWTPSRLLLASAKKRYSIPYADVAHGFGVTRKGAAKRVVLALKRPVPHGKQALFSVAFTPCLEQKKAEEGRLAPCAGAGAAYPELSGTAFDLAASAFAKASGCVLRLRSADGVFASAQGNASVGAYFRSVNDGELFPLREGLLFLDKPVLFVPVQSINAIQLGRGGACSARSFDIEVSCRDGTTHTFSMIDTAELEPLAMYVRALGIGADGAGANDGAVKQEGHGEAGGGVKEEEEEEEEEFFPPGEEPASSALPTSTGGDESRAGAEGDDEDSAWGGEAGSRGSDSESGPASTSGAESDTEGDGGDGYVSNASGDRMIAASKGGDSSGEDAGEAGSGVASGAKTRPRRRRRRAAAAVAARRMGATFAGVAADPRSAAVKAEPVAPPFVRDASEQPEGKRARS